MQRELKFRVWDKTKKSFVTRKGNFTTNDPYYSEYFLTLDGNLVYLNYDNHDKENECIIQQYTGLKDKNGREIYEGDIVEWNKSLTTGGFNQFNFQVVFEEEGGIFSPELSVFKLKPIGYDEEFRMVCGLTKFDIKVIGNIFENLELLNV